MRCVTGTPSVLANLTARWLGSGLALGLGVGVANPYPNPKPNPNLVGKADVLEARPHVLHDAHRLGTHLCRVRVRVRVEVGARYRVGVEAR